MHNQMLQDRKAEINQRFERALTNDIVSEQFPMPKFVYVFHQELKSVSIINMEEKTSECVSIDMKNGIPHNFMSIQLGVKNPRAFIIGGGELRGLPDTMLQCRELMKKDDGTYYFKQKRRMRYPRQGHALA